MSGETANSLAPGGDDLAELKARLQEAEDTLNAIRNGEVDAVVVGGPSGQKVYTLENADRPYRVLVEQMQEGAVTLTSEGLILYCNQRFATIVRTPRDRLIGLPMDRFLGSRECVVLRTLLSHESADGVSEEFTLRAAGGTEVPVNISLVDLNVDAGMPRIVCCVVTDLSHNLRRSHELAAANARLAHEIEERGRAEESLSVALDAADMGTWDLDLIAKMTRRSPRHDQIFGYGVLIAVWTLETTLDHFVPEDRPMVAQAFVDAATLGSIELNGRIKRADDCAIRWVHLKGRTYYEGGEAVRIAGVIADVTDRRVVDDQLRQAQKMEAVGQLTGGLAHDFNNLLTIIGGSLDLLGRRLGDEGKIGTLLETARQGVGRGAKLNQQLLAFSRRQDLRTEAICVNDLIPDFEHLLDRAVGETVAVRIDKAADLWHCLTDSNQLETAIVNLAINARDAMLEGGTLTLATANATVGPQAAVRWGASPGDYVVISVADTGIGMTADIASRVFEPFFTTKEIGKGTGLGLSQVYGFAKQSGGFVTIETEVGQGTKIEIHLPRTSPRSVADEPAPPRAGEISGEGVVLVVEDDATVRETTCALLHDLGYQVIEAESARMALEIINGGMAIDLVFTDVIMPGGMNGIELATVILEQRPGLPVLLTSGYTAQHLTSNPLPAICPMLRKPYAQADLSKAVAEAIQSRRS